MVFIPQVPGAPRPGFRRVLKIALGAALAVLLMLPPLLVFSGADTWDHALPFSVLAGTGTAVLVALMGGFSALVMREGTAGAPARRPRRKPAESARLRAEMAATLDAVETELRRLRWWQDDPPPLLERFRSGELRDFKQAPSFELWLQCVLLPNARQAVAEDAMPASSSVGVMAMREYDCHSNVEEAQPLLSLLNRFDAQANAYVGFDPLVTPYVQR